MSALALRLGVGIVQHGLAKAQQRQQALHAAQAEAMNEAFAQLQQARMAPVEHNMAYTRPPIVIPAPVPGIRRWDGNDVPVGLDIGMVRLASLGVRLGELQAEQDVELLKEAVSPGFLKNVVQRSAASPSRLAQFANRVEQSAVGAVGGLAPVRSMGARGAIADVARRESTLRAAQPGIGAWAPRGGPPGMVHRDAFGNAATGGGRWIDPTKLQKGPTPVVRDTFGNAASSGGAPPPAPAATSPFRQAARPPLEAAPVAAPAAAPAAAVAAAPVAAQAAAPAAAPPAAVPAGKGFLGKAKRTALGLGLGGLGLYAGGKVLRGGLRAMSEEGGPHQYGAQDHGGSTVAYGINEYGQPDLRAPFVQH